MILAAVLFAAALADASAGVDQPVTLLSPIGGEAHFLQRPSAANFAALYPHGAANVGMPGHAALSCSVQPDGRLQKCRVQRESPQGAGFGSAALGLSHYFRLDTERAATQAEDFDFSIGFATATGEDAQLVMGPWLAAPGFADTNAVYPDIGGGVTGQVFLHCALERDGHLKDCKALYEHPIDRDFDVAALKLAHLFQMRVDPAYLKSHEPLSANVVVGIPAPFGDDARQRRIADPVWLEAPSFAALTRLFPAQAAAKGVTSGTGTVDCTVAADGTLVDCQRFGEGDPPGLGFPDAALKAAARMRMSPWTDDGGPVDGARVRVPVRFAAAAQ